MIIARVESCSWQLIKQGFSLFVCLQMALVIRNVFVTHLVERMESVFEGRRLDKTKIRLDCGRMSINWQDMVVLAV